MEVTPRLAEEWLAKNKTRLAKGKALAKEWLAKNTTLAVKDEASDVCGASTSPRKWGNRRLSDKAVKTYAADMLAGRWKQTGSTISFDTDGNLLDGQHRLRALVLAGVTLPFPIVTGLHPDTFDTYDIGRSRSSADALEMAGMQDGRRVASALAVVIMYDRGIQSKIREDIKTNQVLEKLIPYQDLPPALQELGNIKIRLMRGSVFDGLYYVFRRTDPVLALEYMNALRSGRNVEKFKAWHTLRERLIRNTTAIHKMDEVYVAALVIKGWNCARAGRDTARMSWMPHREDFPVAL
jgi:hypothetical protein